MYFGNDFDRFLHEALQFHPGGKISLIDMNKLRYLAAVQTSFHHQSTDSLSGYPNKEGGHPPVSKNIEEEDYEEDLDQLTAAAGIATFGNKKVNANSATNNSK